MAMAQLLDPISQALVAAKAFIWEVPAEGGSVFRMPDPSSLYGLPKGGLGDQLESYLACVHPDDREQLSGKFAALLRGTPLRTSYRVVRPDGSIRRFVSRGEPVFRNDGTLWKVVGSDADITDVTFGDVDPPDAPPLRQRLAHELNNPLATVLNCIEILKRETLRPEALETLRIAEQEAWRISALIDGILRLED
jgi:hypothetical protein